MDHKIDLKEKEINFDCYCPLLLSIPCVNQCYIYFSDINECSPNPCLNGAVCLDGINGYVCDCQPGWAGVNCQTSKFCSLVVMMD